MQRKLAQFQWLPLSIRQQIHIAFDFTIEHLRIHPTDWLEHLQNTFTRLVVATLRYYKLTFYQVGVVMLWCIWMLEYRAPMSG